MKLMADPTVKPIPRKAAIIDDVISFSCSSTTLWKWNELVE